MSTTSSGYYTMEEEFPILTCEICIEPMTENNKFNNENRCSHPFCSDCIAKYIEAKIGDNTAAVSCPASNCEKLLDPLSCRSILPAKLFERWCDVLCEFAVLRCESVYCPSAECSTLVLNECGGNITRSECPNCKKIFCFQCKIPWHVGFGCNETEQLRDQNDILFGELVEKNNWMRCPGCNFRVEKIEGCPNITCRCGILFCYTCGKIKNACECNTRNMVIDEGHIRAGTNVANGRGRCMSSWVISVIFNLMINALFLVLIVELYKMKRSKSAKIIATILLNVYYTFVFPLAGYSMCKSCCGRRR